VARLLVTKETVLTEGVVSLITGFKKSICWWRSMRIDRSVVAGGSLKGSAEAHRFPLLGLVKAARFFHVSSRLAPPVQSVLRHFLPIGRVASSNVSRSKGCRASGFADSVASKQLLFSRASVLMDFAQSAVFRVVRSFSSIAGTCQSTSNALALSSACGPPHRSALLSMLALDTPNYQNNSPRSLVPQRLTDCSMRKTRQDEKERNVDQRVAVGRMPDCDR
jgi:hypothetical protein